MDLQGDQCKEKGDRANGEEEQNTIHDLEISLHALTGWFTPRTIRMEAQIGDKELMALVDGGSTHNFISTKMVKRLRLPTTPTIPFTV